MTIQLVMLGAGGGNDSSNGYGHKEQQEQPILVVVGASGYNNQNGVNGGSGVVILRIPVNYSGTTTGSPTVTDVTVGSVAYKVLTYNSSGTYTA